MLSKTRPVPKVGKTSSDPFDLGWRTVSRPAPDGQIYYERIPLTLYDILHPQIGDFRVHSSDHEDDCLYLTNAFRSRLHNDPQAIVLPDVRVAWATPEMEAHGPDISVIFGVKDIKNWATFDEVEEGTKPCLVVEVTSPSTRNVDLTEKVHEYALVGVDYYLIVDTKWEKGQSKRVLLGYVLNAGRYEALEADERGWLWLPPVGLWVGLENNRPYCYDETGQRVADYTEVTLELTETKNRLKNETQARQDEAQARQEAEAKAVAEALARQEAEDQLREMAAELERLRAKK